MKIAVPLCCVISYYSFKFLCKSTINGFHRKTAIRDWGGYQHIIEELEGQTHVKIANNMERAYLIELDSGSSCLYFD